MSTAVKTTAADETTGKKPKVKKVINGSPTNGAVTKTPRKRATKKAVEAKETKKNPKAAKKGGPAGEKLVVIVVPVSVVDQRRGLAARIDGLIKVMTTIAVIKRPLERKLGTPDFHKVVEGGIKVDGLDLANIAALLDTTKLPRKVLDAITSIAATQEEKRPTCKRVHTAVGVLHGVLLDAVKKCLLEYYALRGITPPEEKLYDTLRNVHLIPSCVEMYGEWRAMSKVLDPKHPRAEMKKDGFRLMSVVELDQWVDKLQSKVNEMRPLYAAKIKADKERKDGELAAARKRQSDEQRAENEERDGIVKSLLYVEFKKIEKLHSKLKRDLPGTGKIGTDFHAPIAILRVEAQRFKDWGNSLEVEFQNTPEELQKAAERSERAAKHAAERAKEMTDKATEKARVRAVRLAGEDAKDATIRAAEKATRDEVEKRRNLIRQSERLGVSAVKLAADINARLGQGTVQAPPRIEIKVSTAVLEQSVQALALTVQEFEMVLDYGLVDPKPQYWIEAPQDRAKRLRLIQEAKPLQWRIRYACKIMHEQVPDSVETGYFDLALVDFTDWLKALKCLMPSMQQRAKEFQARAKAGKKRDANQSKHRADQPKWGDADAATFEKYLAEQAEYNARAMLSLTDARGVIETNGTRVNTTAGKVIERVADLAPPDINAP